MNELNLQIKGMLPLRRLLENSNRSYGIEVHKHLPAKTFDLNVCPFKDYIHHPKDLELLESLGEFLGLGPSEREFPEAYAATVEDAFVVGNSGMVVTPDGWVIAETASMIGYEDQRCLNVESLKREFGNLQYLGHRRENVLSAGNPNGGFSHHLMESLFSILWFEGKVIDRIQAVNGSNFNRLQEFLGSLNINTDILFGIEKKQVFSAEQVSFFGPCSFLMVRPETVEMVQRVLMKPFSSKELPSRKFYLISEVLAEAAKGRMPENEPELRAFLLGNGYECLDPATLDLKEKIRIFSQASHSIALAGSGIANPLYFSPPNARVGMLSYKENLTKTFSSHIGLNRVLGYNDMPPALAYPEFCMDQGRWLTNSHLSLRTGHLRYPHLQRISYSLEEKPHKKIDMQHFKRWFDQFNH